MIEQIQKQRQRNRQQKHVYNDADDGERQVRAAQIIDRLAELSTQATTMCVSIDKLLTEAA